MRFHTLVGVLPHEREIAQPLELDVEAWVATRARAAGEPPALDYRALYECAAREVARAPIGFLEDFVERVAEAALALDAVRRVRVVARKPHVPLPGPLAAAEVSVERARDD